MTHRFGEEGAGDLVEGWGVRPRVARIRTGLERSTMSRILRGLAALSIAALSIVPLTACNTVKGVGTDIHNVGQAGQNVITPNRNTTTTRSEGSSDY